MESPKSLTALIHVRFNYKEIATSPPGVPEMEMVGKVLDQASELEPDLQAMLLKFAVYMETIKGNKQGPS